MLGSSSSGENTRIDSIARAQVLPERLDVGGAREPPGHADDRDRLTGVDGLARSTAHAARTSHRRAIARARAAGVGAAKNVAGDSSGRPASRSPGQHAQRQQRVATQLEEPVEGADPIEAEHLGEDPADRGLAVAGGRAVGLGELGALVTGRRQARRDRACRWR